MRAQTPSPKRVPLGTTTAARPGARASGAPQLPHDQLQEEQRRLGGLHVREQVLPYPGLLLATEGRVGHDHIHAIRVAKLGDRVASELP